MSFQRFAWPEAGVVDRAPSSLGALPIGLGAAHDLILPLAEDECFWIGLSVTPNTLGIRLALAVELRSGEVLDAISGRYWGTGEPSMVDIPDTLRIEGIRRPDGRLQVFTRTTHDQGTPLCVRLRFLIAPSSKDNNDNREVPYGSEIREVMLRLVDYATFAGKTGLSLEPLSAEAGYQGWLLP